MDVCRICLSKNAGKEISELQTGRDEANKSYTDIMWFCLGIQVTEGTKLSKKLCIRCHKKILSFHKFKCMALESESYLKSLSEVKDEKHEVFISMDSEGLRTDATLISCFSDAIKQEKEDNENQTNDFHEFESDDELLSVIKLIKYEYIEEGTKEQVKTRGRPKSVKPKIKEKKKIEICKDCGKCVRDLKEHSLQHLPKEQRRRIKCKMCDKTFASHNAKYRHYRIKHLGIKSHCTICNKDVVDLKHHHLVIHEPSALPFKCVVCERGFVSRSTLEFHMTAHTRDRPFRCELCDKTYRSKVCLLHHTRQVHDKEKTHLCQFCSKSFFKKYHLQVHLRSHTKEKPYKCSECDKSFSSCSGLKSHKLIHAEVKSFKCTYCDSSFTKPGYLRNHLISHTKEKRHSCKYCGVKFGRSDHRKRHEFTAHQKHLLSSPLPVTS